MKRIYSLVFCFTTISLYAQQNVGIGTSTPAASAQLHINSTNKGLLTPRLTTAQRTVIASPANGLLVYDTDTNSFWFYKNNVWTELGAGGGGGGSWSANGSDIYNNNSGRVGIGTTTPLAPLCVVGTSTWGTASFTGDAFTSHFNYPDAGGTQNTYIRGGKAASHVILNDEGGLGNVGIGTRFPFSKLTVNGDGAFAGSPISYDFSEQGGYYFNGGAISLTTPVSAIESKGIRMDGSTIQSYTIDTDDPSVDDYAAPFSINPLGGNVGIGTPGPLPNSKFTLQTDGDYATAMTIRNPSGSASFETYIGGPINGNTISLGTQGYMPIVFFTNGANRLFINAEGNVGIGTDNPTYKLSVRGNIRSNEVVVETGWADYVFANDYKLKTLAEVESFIQQHKHLPNIPSAKEIESNGLHIGDVQKRMMEKIEELTLYVIDLKKEIEQLKSK
jgi:hypothetical protein